MQIKKLWACVLATMFIAGLVIGATPVSSSSEEWTLVHDGRGVKAYPDLREYVWEKVPSAPPHGTYDKIGLHRVVKAGIEPRGVFFLLPGTWSSGEQLVSNPPEDNWTTYENYTFCLYLANRDFDVYSIDYRTHFVPIYLNSTQLSFMVDWGWDQWISDIKEAVEKAKEVSGAEKIYISGESFGGGAAANYASLYWEEDLKGILPRDGGTVAKYPEWVTNTYNLTAEIEEMNATGTWSNEVGAPYEGTVFIMQYAEEHPDAPAEYPPGHPLEGQLLPPGIPFDNITEWAVFSIYWAWGPGGVSNLYGGYGKPSVMIHIMSTFDRYWPTRLSLESAAIRDWDNCTYVTYDFDDHYCEIDVPLLGFTSELFGLNTWGSFRHGITNPDFTGIMLPGYGHLDVFSGEYSEEDVSEPTYQWLMGARLLTVTSSPITGITFNINGTPETTPYTEWLEGFYTLEMPETHNGWIWSRWLEDGDTNRIKTVTMNTSITLTGVFEHEIHPVETATGTGTATFVTDVGIMQDLTAVDEATLPTAGKPSLEFTHGFFSFKVTGLTPGQAVTITITLPSNMPVGTQYWICQEGSWYQIPIGDDDGDNVITITKTDGGLGDADGIQNGVIEDPGGPGKPPPLPPVGGKAIPIDNPIVKPELQTTWIWLTAIILPLVATVVYVKKRKRHTEINP